MARGRGFISWLRNSKATTAVEFALIAMPFTLFNMGIMELALMFTGASLLETATNEAARSIRTGQLQVASPADQEEMFKETLCDYAGLFLNCDDLQYEVLSTDDGSFFTAGALGADFDDDGNLMSGGFDPGGSSDVVLIRVVYKYNYWTPLIGPLLGGADNARILQSTVVIQTEPYEFEGTI